MIRSLYCLCLLFAVLILDNRVAQGQALPPATTAAGGVQPFGTFGGGSLDVINLGDLNIHLTFPLLQKKMRGMDFSYALTYDSQQWTQDDNSMWVPSDSANHNWNFSGPGGSNSYLITSETSEYNCQETVNGVSYPSGMMFTYSYVDSSGNIHSFGYSAYTTADCGTFTQHGFPVSATDGSQIKLECVGCTPTSTTPYALTIQLPSGQSVLVSTQGNPSVIQDSNGNYINAYPMTTPDSAHLSNGLSTITDSTNNDYVVSAVLSPAATGYPEMISSSNLGFEAGDGTQKYMTVQNEGFEVKSSFGCAGVNEYDSGALNQPDPYEDTPQALPSLLYLRDGAEYRFTYEPTTAGSSSITGRIASVIFPHGGSISYQYGPVNCSDGSPLSLTRTVNDGNGNISRWTYQRTYLPATSQWQTLVTDPVGNQTVYTFIIGTTINNAATVGGLSYDLDVNNYYEVAKTVYSGPVNGGVVLLSSTTRYNSNASELPFTYPIQHLEVSTSPNGGTQSSSVVKNFNSLGLLTEIETTDYSGAPLTLTVISYASLGPIFNKPSNITQIYGAGNLLSSTTYSYDEYPVTASGAQNLNAVTGPRGNVTTISRYNGSTTLSSHYTYYDTGLPNTATDVNGELTTYTYGQCWNSYLTASVTDGLSTSTSWNCFGGVPTSSQDVNGNTTTITYADNMWRPTTIVDPLGTTTTLTYPSTTSNTSSSTTTYAAGLPSTSTLVTYDGLGRPILQQSQQGPGSSVYTSVSQVYDLLGNITWSSVPYSAASGAYITSGPGTTETYDALGRNLSVVDAGGGTLSSTYNLNDVLVTQGPAVSGENAKSRQLEYNALGQLTSVCEITTMAPSGSCGQSTASNGFLTSYTYAGNLLKTVSQNSQTGTAGTQTRSLSYDLVGRKVGETIPETGTSSFVYDTDPAGVCPGTFTGDQVKTVDNAGNTTCFTYDALHRVLSSKVVAGPYQSVTPQSNFIYDAAALSGTSMQNAKGALAESYTCTGSCTSKLTDTFYSKTISPGSVLSQMWEATPNSNGYFLTQGTVNANGSPAAFSGSLNGAPIGFPSISYGIDSWGRPATVSDTTSNLQLVSQVSYNNLTGALTGVSLGNGDSDGFGYDPLTGRPVSLAYTIQWPSALTVNSSLTWNPNGSLQNLTMTDSSDATKNQNCSYAMDDINRLASVNCVGSWAQTFTYDPFGNITKGTPSNPAPGQITATYAAGYNSLTNQAQSGVTASYDAIGNQTLAETNSLSWNAAGQAVNVNGVTGTYDANGRLVETSGGGGQPPAVSTGTITVGGTEQLTTGPATSGSGTITITGFEGRHEVCVPIPHSGTRCTFMPDTGMIIVTIDGFTASATYSLGSTDPSLASALATSLSVSGSPVMASAAGNVVTMTSLATGSISNYAFSVTSDPDFSGAASGAALTGGTDGGTVYDTGNLSVIVNGTTVSVPWTQSSSAQSLASALAAALQASAGGFLSATASGSTISLLSLPTGSSSNWPLQCAATDTQASPASFSIGCNGMSGGSNGGSAFTQYVYSPGGQKLATVQNGVMVQATVPLPGGGTAVYSGQGFAYFRHKDWLGSSRLATTWDHRVYSKEAYAPFGETYNEAGTPDRSFTGQDQDTAAVGVYDYLFRRYDPVAGRWLSPDPLGWGAVSPAYPQSLNRYAYVQNNPMSLKDPSGLDCIYLNDDSTSVEEVQQGNCEQGDGGYWVPGTYNNRAVTQPDGTLTGFESTLGYNGFVSNFADDGSISVQTMSIWMLPMAGSGYTPTGMSFADVGQEQGMLSLMYAGQQAGWIGTPQGIAGIYGLSAGGAVAFDAAAALDFADVAVGTTERGSLHFAIGADGTWMHGVTTLGGDGIEMTSQFARSWAQGAFQIPVPVLNLGAVLPEEGAAVSNCFTGVCSAVLRGWLP